MSDDIMEIRETRRDETEMFQAALDADPRRRVEALVTEMARQHCALVHAALSATVDAQQHVREVYRTTDRRIWFWTLFKRVISLGALARRTSRHAREEGLAAAAEVSALATQPYKQIVAESQAALQQLVSHLNADPVARLGTIDVVPINSIDLTADGTRARDM